MFYIHRAACISPQETFSDTKTDLSREYESPDNKILALEPPYPGIPDKILRRMAKAVRMGVGTALPLIRPVETGEAGGDDRAMAGAIPQGIIIGTANGGMEESVKFLKQIADYNEEMLTPGNFVQSIPNAISSQISLLSKNKGYNTTHVHRGLAFEYAALDAAMLANEHPGSSYLVGGVDEMASYHYNLEYLKGSYKKEMVSSKRLYDTDSPGSLAGEGAAMFLVSNQRDHALAHLRALVTLHSEDREAVSRQLRDFLDQHLASGGSMPDLFLTGENGDNRFSHFYSGCETVLDKDIPVARYKHVCGEYPTAAAFALWLSCRLIGGWPLPEHMKKRTPAAGKETVDRTAAREAPSYKTILFYNNYKGIQHSFMLVTAVR